MVYVVIVFVLLLAAGVGLCVLSVRSGEDAPGIVGIIALIIVLVMACVLPFAGYSWVAAERKAKIINAEYGTKYTREDVFYGHDVIEQIQQIKRKRIEINGNILNGKKEN